VPEVPEPERVQMARGEVAAVQRPVRLPPVRPPRVEVVRLEKGEFPNFVVGMVLLPWRPKHW